MVTREGEGMGADKNSLQRKLGLCPESTSKCPPHVLLRSRSNHCATDLRNNTGTQALKTSSGTNNSGPKTSTGQTSHQHRLDRSRAGHPTNTLRVTQELTETNRVTRTSTPGHPPYSCDHSQTTLHRLDQCRAPIRPVPGNLPKNSSRTCPADLDGNPRL